MQRATLLSTALSVVIAAAGCRPEVVIASSDPDASSGTGGSGTAGTATAGTATGGGGTGGVSESPSAGDGGAPPLVEPARILADSVADFSLTQSELGWYYGYDLGSLDTFTLMTKTSIITQYRPESHDVWDCWVGETAHWTQIFQLGAHPNGTISSAPANGILQRAVRRWVSPFAGEATIAGEVAKIDVGSLSNGVDASVWVDGTQSYTTFIGGQDGGGRSYKFLATLKVGSTVDFVLDPHEGDDRNDLTRFTGIVVAVNNSPAP